MYIFRHGHREAAGACATGAGGTKDGRGGRGAGGRGILLLLARQYGASAGAAAVAATTTTVIGCVESATDEEAVLVPAAVGLMGASDRVQELHALPREKGLAHGLDHGVGRLDDLGLGEEGA
eukprot:evm.model.NODE_3053_length_17624_cov_21.646164.6